MTAVLMPLYRPIFMLPNKFDITLALKAIALSDSLSASEKRIAAAVIDHFNRGNGRCDPSYETIAAILSINVRTVGRGVTKLVKINFFKMITHGGINNCNSYQPNWVVFRALEAHWKRQRREYANRFKGKEMSPLPGQYCPVDVGQIALQTYSNNIIPLTSSAAGRPEKVVSTTSGLSLSGFGIFAARLEKRLGKDDWHAWFRNVHFVEATKDKIILSAENRFIKSRIEQQLEHKILDCYRPEFPHVLKVEVLIRE
jgi:DnaA N-terminal domain/Helix-turn-helix domain